MSRIGKQRRIQVHIAASTLWPSQQVGSTIGYDCIERTANEEDDGKQKEVARLQLLLPRVEADMSPCRTERSGSCAGIDGEGNIGFC